MQAPPVLRPYQASAIEQLREGLRQGKRRLVLIAPTGSGKTVMFSAMIRSAVERGRSAIVIAHRKELVDQTVAKLAQFGVRAGVMMGKDRRRDGRLPVQVCSIQTLARRLDRLPPADLVVFDECHHSMSSTSREVLAKYDKAVHIGATATPWRTDKLGLADLYEDHVVAATPRQLIESGSLVGYEPFAYDAPDLHEVGMLAGEFNQRELGLACNTDVLVGSVVREYQAHAHGRRALVFPVNIEGSRNLVGQFCAAGYRAEHLDCHTPKGERERIIDGLRSGAVTIVSSVGVLTEGFDAPAAEVCILVRPTLSVGLYMQMVGRVLRPHEGKTSALIHDHAGNILRHGFPDDERDYSLSATPERTAAVRTCTDCGFLASAWRPDGTCPKCGQMQHLAEDRETLGGGERSEKVEVEGKRIGRAQIEALRAKLAEVGSKRELTDRQAAKVLSATRAEMAAEFLRLQLVAQQKGFKPGFVSHQFRSTFGHWPKFQSTELQGVVPASRPFLPLLPRESNEPQPQRDVPVLVEGEAEWRG